MSEAVVAKTAGLLVTADKEPVSWFHKGTEYNPEEGDVFVTNVKQATSLGILDIFNEMKAEAAKEKKAEKAESGDKPARVRSVVPRTGTYTIAKRETLEKAATEKVPAKLLLENTSFEKFWEVAPDKFMQKARDGSPKEMPTSGFVAYAIKRSFITVDAPL